MRQARQTAGWVLYTVAEDIRDAAFVASLQTKVNVNDVNVCAFDAPARLFEEKSQAKARHK